MSKILGIAAVVMSIAAGCSGPSGGSTPPGSGSGGSHTLSISPASVGYSGSSGQQTTFSVSGAIGAVSASSGSPAIVSLSAPVTGASGANFVATPVASGVTAITATDQQGASATANVTVQICLPPTPAFNQIYPADKAMVAGNFGTVWIAVRNNDPPNSVVPAFYVRLLATDGTIVTGGFLSFNASQPPSGSAPPIPGYTTYATASVPALSSGKSYQLQLADPNYQCIPPIITGSFST